MSRDSVFKFAEEYYKLAAIIKNAFIKKLPSGKYRVLSQKGKNLGTFKTKEEAQKRLRLVEFFKHKKIKKNANKSLDLSKIEAFSLSSIMRQINKQLGPEACIEFAELFKNKFDDLILAKKSEVEEHALVYAVKEFNKHYSININKEFLKL